MINLFLAIPGGLIFFSVMDGSSLLGLLGLLVGVVGFLSAGLLVYRNAKTLKSPALNANSINGEMKKSDALQPVMPSLITSRTFPRMASMVGKALVLIFAGWLLGQAWEYNHTFVLWDLKVMAEPGDKIIDPTDGKLKVVPQRTFYFQRASGPVGQMFPRTFCKKLVPGLHDGYNVEVLVGTVDPYPVDCWNVAPGPLGIVYNQGE